MWRTVDAARHGAWGVKELNRVAILPQPVWLTARVKVAEIRSTGQRPIERNQFLLPGLDLFAQISA
jgi:hypothetical protein